MAPACSVCGLLAGVGGREEASRSNAGLVIIIHRRQHLYHINTTLHSPVLIWRLPLKLLWFPRFAPLLYSASAGASVRLFSRSCVHKRRPSALSFNRDVAPFDGVAQGAWCRSCGTT